MATARRRVRTGRRPVIDTDNGLRTIAQQKASSLYECEQHLRAAHAAWALASTETLEAMQKAKMTEIPVVDGAFVVVETPQGRKTTVIDLKLFKAAVKEDEFLECVKVSVTEAKKVLSEKALKKISTEIPAKPGQPAVKVVYPKAPKKG